MDQPALTVGPIFASSDADFESHRRHLLGLAYRMLASWSEAEDIVQEAGLRWLHVCHEEVRAPRAFLVSMVTRLCLDHLRLARVRRETYVGLWLPEPLPNAEAYVEPNAPWGSDLSVAMLLLLQRLTPPQRAAFLLHDIFDVPFADIAEILECSEAACRQLASRARRLVRSAPRRHPVDEQLGTRLAEAFMRASEHGDLHEISQLLKHDAILYGDGGGKKIAVYKPLLGADRIARFFAGIARKSRSKTWGSRIITANGMPAILALEADGLPRVTTLDIQDNRISGIYMVRNPDKLLHLHVPDGHDVVRHLA